MTDAFRETYYCAGDGLTLYTRIYEPASNDGGCVLCLHGLTRNSRDFEDIAPHLATRHRVVVPDLRGRGRSAHDPNMQNYNAQVYLADVLTLLGAINATQVAVIGTSLGGMLAMMLAATRRDRVAGIVLNDVGPEIDPIGMKRIKQYAGRLPAVRSWGEALEQTKTVYGAAWPGLDHLRWQTLVRRAYRENAAGIPQVDIDPKIGESLRSAPDVPLDLWPLWSAQHDVPTLAIRGAHSDILSAETFARMKREKPNLEQLTVPNRGHVPLLDEPECVAAIDRFLLKLDFRAPATLRD
jgi:pimeloyl-ACP methyl ester carboxylesterase